MIGYDGFKRITGTKVHVATEQNGLPVSIVMSPANNHDSVKFVDVIESISDYLDSSATSKIKSIYADKGYDSTTIRKYLKSRNITSCIPKRNYCKTRRGIKNHDNMNYNYNKTRFVVERFFAWLKNGFHRTRIRYERIADNYLGLLNIASFLMYCKVLR